MGVEGGIGVCGYVQPGGAISLRGPIGSFNSRTSLEFWIKTDQYLPDLNLNLAGDYQACNLVSLHSQEKSGVSGYYSRYDISLSKFDTPEPATVVTFVGQFMGCNNLDVNNIRKISFRNDKHFQQYVCIDQIKLLG
eukprot:TRINITY_DN26053_c1_g1_i2.p4 TRINITY_DN26053_c1_g1~~TRINITY_DN26053_c1_g1_i2.p4  ORF type:complete len:136 (-),score=8.57 TRINITY_DN26053_c1_g1_i2:916-1323(-)